MTWAKVDDQFHGHRKAKRAWKGHPRALGLHLLAISYCAGHLTDGLVDDEFVEEKIPATREREGATGALVAAALWTREDEGWRINDWLDYNPSRAEVLDKRRKDSERKARGRQADPVRSPNGVQPESVTHAGVVPSRPVPTRIPPYPPRGNRTRDREAWEENVVTWAGSVGVTGPRRVVLTALKGCGPWKADDAPAAFRTHVSQFFSESLTVREAA